MKTFFTFSLVGFNSSEGGRGRADIEKGSEGGSGVMPPSHSLSVDKTESQSVFLQTITPI